MKIIQTTNKYSKSELEEINSENYLFVENVGMFLGIEFTHIPVHRFNSYLMIYCKKGTVMFQEGDTKEYLSSGFIKIIPPDTHVDFTYYPEDHNEYYFIHFVGRLAQSLLDCIFIDGNTVFVGSRPDIAELFSEIEKSFEISEDDQTTRAMLLKSIFYTMLKTRQNKNVKNIQSSLAISKVIIYIQNHFNQNITVDQLANMCYISKNHFMTLFKEHTGHSPINYIINIRIETAKNLLENSNYTINEISAETGFKNSLYFSRIFKKKIGVSPNQYRKEYQENEHG